MGVETPAGIAGLNILWPLGDDQRSTVDDHLRLIKSMLLIDLPNITGPITATQADLNTLTGANAAGLTSAELLYVADVTSALQAQLNGKQAFDGALTVLAALSNADGNFIVGNGVNFVAEGPTVARLSLGLGSLAVKETIDETDMDWGNSDGITQGCMMLASSMEPGIRNTAWNPYVLGDSVAGGSYANAGLTLKIPATVNSLRFRVLYKHATGNNVARMRLGSGGVFSGIITFANNTNYNWSSLVTLDVSALSGFTDLVADYTINTSTDRVYIKAIAWEFI